MNKKIEDTIAKLVHEHALALESLTEQQFVCAIKQALDCGDFSRCVQISTGAQAVVYIPYAREQELKYRIAQLEALLIFNGIKENQE